MVLVKPGDRLPVDGVVIGGVSSIDQSAITGESRLSASIWATRSAAGTINGGVGALEVEVTKLASETTFERIITWSGCAQMPRQPAVIDRFSQPIPTPSSAPLLAMICPALALWIDFSTTLYRRHDVAGRGEPVCARHQHADQR